MDPGRYETLVVHGALAPGEESMRDFAEREGARMTYVPRLGQPIRPGEDLAALRRLGAIMRGFRPDVVHTHTAKAGFLGRLAAILALEPRPAIVHTYHGHVLERYFGPARSRTYRGLERWLGRHSDRLIGVSQATVDDLVRLGIAPRERFSVVPLGLDLEPFASLAAEPGGPLRGELGLADDEILATYVGRLVPIKRLDVLLRAVATARGGGAAVRLAVVGDGEMRPDLERLAGELGIRSHAHFLGYRRDLRTIAEASDVYVLSSDNEGMAQSLIEGAAAARPVAATAAGGVPEVVAPDAGMLVPQGDAEALGAAVAELAGDRGLRMRLGERARANALARFSAERLIADMDAIYTGLIRGRAAGVSQA
jgi:glycosyltransferase involved in cell wall biosynthesis